MNSSKLYLGCAVWSYKGWVGDFYPEKTKPKDFLTLYSQQFNTVEGNTTFYAVPQPKTVSKWANETTNNFKFCPKFPKTVTHQGLLQPRIAEAANFLSVISGLKTKLGITFLQLPPSYSPQYLEDLRQFLTALPQYNIAVEVRHLDWFNSPNKEQLNQLLEELNVAKVLLDTRAIYNSKGDPQANSSRRKPDVPMQPIMTNDFAFIRYISHPKLEYNQTYLQQWAIQLKDRLADNKTVYFFVHCPIEDYSPNIANYFKTLLQNQEIEVSSISSNITQKSNQLSLF